MLRSLKAVAVALAFVAPVTAQATDFSFVGTFQQDDEHQLFSFTVGAPSTVTLRTWSYAGGVNAAGATIARGGFDPILALFDSTGTNIGQNDDGGFANVAGDAVTGRPWDTFFTINLSPGTYTASVQEYDNFANATLAAGFFRDGQGNFTAGFGCPDAQPAFNDVSGVAGGCGRDNHWAFDILNVESATTVPEPGSIALLGLGLAGLAFARRARA